MDKNVIISVKTVIFTLAILVFGYMMYQLGGVLVILISSGLIVISLENSVKFFMSKTFLNKPLSRNLAVLITYFFLILFIVFTLTIGLPPVLVEGQKLVNSLINILQNLKLTADLNISISSLIPQISSLSGGVLTATLSVFSNLATVLSVLIFSIYLSLDWENLKASTISIFPEKNQDEILDTIAEIETSIGVWVKGQLLLMIIIGVTSFFGLWALQVNYPLALGLVAGILEVVPVIGPLITAVIAGIIAFSDSPVKGIAVVIVFSVIQQLENTILVPKIMGKVSGFSPIAILLALLVGSTFLGIVGAIIAVPLTMILVIVVKRVLKYSL